MVIRLDIYHCEKAIASYLSTTRGVQCVAEQIIITSGSQQALEVIARVILEPGDPKVSVALESFIYFPSRPTQFRSPA
jgi:DNA-binding transcriptional MocR family regulator